MSINLKKKDTSKHLPRAFYLFRPAADWEALQSSYSLGLIKTLVIIKNFVFSF